MKLTIHLPKRLEDMIPRIRALPECSILSDSKLTLFVFEKGLDRLRDESRLAPEPQLEIPKSKYKRITYKRSKKGKRK